MRLNRWFATVSSCLRVDFTDTPQKTPALPASRFRLLATHPDTPLIPEHRPVVFAQQVRQLADISFIGGRRRHGMRQAAVHIGADANLHAEIPLVALLGLTHFRARLLRLIVGR